MYLLDNLFLPTLINSNEEVYIPDVRNLNIYNAEMQLQDLGFNVETIKSRYNEKFTPNTVMKMSPRAFTKIKKG